MVMKIEKIVATPISIPLEKPAVGGTYTVDKRCTVITQIFTDEGAVSEVHNGDDRINGKLLAHIIENDFQPLILGECIFDSERIWQTLFQQTISKRDYPSYMKAIACVDTAIWDLKGKATGRSVRDLVGGHKTSLPIFATGGYYGNDDLGSGIAREIQTWKDAGMSGVKFKVGKLSPEEDAKRVEKAKDVAGDDFFVACDANRAWSVQEAIRFAKLVEPMGIAWFEEPCHWHDDARMMADVRKATSIPINAGQSEISSAGIRRLIDAEAVDYVNFDSSHGGGPTEWLRAAAICRSVGVMMLHHEETVVSSHLLGGTSNGLYVDCFPSADRDPIWSGLLVDRPKVADGKIEIPTEPGFGIHFDWDMVAKHRI